METALAISAEVLILTPRRNKEAIRSCLASGRLTTKDSIVIGAATGLITLAPVVVMGLALLWWRPNVPFVLGAVIFMLLAIAFGPAVGVSWLSSRAMPDIGVPSTSAPINSDSQSQGLLEH